LHKRCSCESLDSSNTNPITLGRSCKSTWYLHTPALL